MANRPSEIRRARVNLVGAGVHIVIAGEVGYRIAIVGALLSANAVTQVTAQDTAATAMMDLYLPANVVIPIPQMDPAWGLVPTGLGLNINVVAAANVGGVIVYRMVPDNMEF